MHTRTHACTQASTHARTHAYTCKHKHTHAHTHACTHTHFLCLFMVLNLHLALPPLRQTQIFAVQQFIKILLPSLSWCFPLLLSLFCPPPYFSLFCPLLYHSTSIFLRGRVVKDVGHLDHVWSYGVREVVSSIPDRGNIVGWVFHPTRRLVRFSHLNMPFLPNSEFI